jgi:hypothetical protein
VCLIFRRVHHFERGTVSGGVFQTAPEMIC